MQDERSKLGCKITISSVHTVRWTTCRRQSLHEHERRCGMKKASTRLLEQETQTPSPAPDLIPAESSTENLHWDWYSKRGHFNRVSAFVKRFGSLALSLAALLPPPFPTSAFVISAGATRYRFTAFVLSFGVGRACRFALLAYLASVFGRRSVARAW